MAMYLEIDGLFPQSIFCKMGYVASLNFAAASLIGPPPAAATICAAALFSFCHQHFSACASASNVSYAGWASLAIFAANSDIWRHAFQGMSTADHRDKHWRRHPRT